MPQFFLYYVKSVILAFVNEVVLDHLINVGSIPPCACDCNVSGNFFALESEDSLLNGVVTDCVGVLSNGTNELGTGGLLHPFDLLCSGVKACELDSIILVASSTDCIVNLLYNAFVGHEDCACALFKESFKSCLVCVVSITGLDFMSDLVLACGGSISVSQFLELFDKAACSVDTGLRFVMLDNTDNILVRSSDVRLDSFEELFSYEAGSESVGGGNGSKNGVLAGVVKSCNVVCPDTGVKLNYGDVGVLCLGEVINEAFADGSENDSISLVGKSGLNHFFLRGKVFCGFACGAAEGYFVTVLSACVFCAFSNGLPECMGFAFSNNSYCLSVVSGGACYEKSKRHCCDKEECN